MENKKTNRANLENKKFIFLQIGFICALTIALMAFEWRSYDTRVYEKFHSNWTEVEELLPISTEQRKPPSPPPVAKPVYTIRITDFPDHLPDDLPIFDAGFDEGMPNPDFIPKLFEELSNVADDTIYNTFSIEVQPEFPGGEAALYKYLRDNIKYPRMANEANIQGTVIIAFVVEKDGSLSGIKTERTPAEVLSNEALRVVSGMPDWSPGKQGGKAVRVSFYLPVKFKLQ